MFDGDSIPPFQVNGEYISEVCGFENQGEMEDAMGIPRGTLVRAAALMDHAIQNCKVHNKNLLFLDCAEGCHPTLNVFMIKDSDRLLQNGPEPGFKETFPLEGKDVESVFREVSMKIVTMSRDWDALTDLHLNTLNGGPFFSPNAKKRVLSETVGEGLIWFGQYDEQTLAMMTARMGGMGETPLTSQSGEA